MSVVTLSIVIHFEDSISSVSGIALGIGIICFYNLIFSLLISVIASLQILKLELFV